MLRSSEHIDDLLDGFVSAVVGGLKLAVWTVFKVRLVVEAAIRDRPAEPFMQFKNIGAMLRSSEHIDDLLDGFVSAVVGGFKLAVWTVFKVRLVVEAAIRDRPAEPFMEEQK
jgi:hypothetical protein